MSMIVKCSLKLPLKSMNTYLLGKVAHGSQTLIPWRRTYLRTLLFQILVLTSMATGPAESAAMQRKAHRQWDRDARIKFYPYDLGTGELRQSILIPVGINFHICKMDIIIPISQVYCENSMKIE
jgi:hypothetical protein